MSLSYFFCDAKHYLFFYFYKINKIIKKCDWEFLVYTLFKNFFFLQKLMKQKEKTTSFNDGK